jgi:preprotein translocase subunit SecB
MSTSQANEPKATPEENLPNISINTQYVKDLSFENLATPGTVQIDSPPVIDLSLDINVTKLSEDNHFEVALNINSKAVHKETTLFVVELVYAGIFHLVNIPEDQQKAVLSVHCTSMIFPYARKIIADVTQDGGFQPLMMDPIDFSRLYYKRMAEEDKANNAKVN